MKRIILGGLATLALTVPLSAADLPYKTPAPPPPPVCLWCGFYVGASAGAGFGDKWWDGNNPTLITAPLGFEILGGPGQSLGNSSLDGFLGGLQAGFNFQSGPMVFGVEGTWTWTNMNGRFPIATVFGIDAQQAGGGFNASSKLDWIATAVGRVGFTIDRAWIYAGGGAAWTQEKDSALANMLVETFEWDGSNTKLGWTFLTGMEYAIDAHWSARIQYNYYDFGTSNVAMTSSNPLIAAEGAGALGISTDLRISTVTAGVNCRFNWDSPIAAGY